MDEQFYYYYLLIIVAAFKQNNGRAKTSMVEHINYFNATNIMQDITKNEKKIY